MIRRMAGELVVEVAVFAAVIGQVALLYQRVFLLTALLVVTAGLVLVAWRDGAVNPCLFAVAAVLGPAGEILCAAAGVWTYSHPAFLGIPLWLPPAWGVVAVMAKEIAATLTRRPLPQA